MKKRKILLTAGLLVLLALVLWGLVRFFPLWETAKTLWENMNSGQYAYELNVELNQEKLTEGQEKLLMHLTWLTGFDREAMCRLTIKGSVRENRIHAMIYPEGAAEPLTELYSDGDNCVICESAIYNQIRSHLVDEYMILRLLMPRQQEELYISLEQIEQLFDLDMKAIREMGTLTEESELSVWKYFMLLTAMSEKTEEDRRSFELKTEKMSLGFELGKETDTARVKMLLEIQDPAETISQNEELISELGFSVPKIQTETVKKLTAVITPGEGGEIQMPESLVDQGIIDIITKIRDWIRENLLDDRGTPVVWRKKERLA